VKRLVAICEGETERRFCADVLGPYLFGSSPWRMETRDVGGLSRYPALRRFVARTLSDGRFSDHEVRFTSLLDLYHLPKDFPGRTATARHPVHPRPYALALEKAFADDLGDQRFIPHLQLHEFETMLFANPEAFASNFEDCGDAIREMKRIAADFERRSSIEHINDDPSTAPSKRIIRLIPEYEGRKPIAGPAIARRIGIPTIRAKCPHFDEWLAKLEAFCRE